MDFFKIKNFILSYFVGLAHLWPGGELYRGWRRLEQVQAYDLAHQSRGLTRLGRAFIPLFFKWLMIVFKIFMVVCVNINVNLSDI